MNFKTGFFSKLNLLRNFTPTLVAFLLFIIFAAPPAMTMMGIQKSELLAANEIIEGYVADVFFKLRGERESPNSVKIIGIGEKSLKELGRFPFPRFVYREFVEKLNEYQVKVAAFDILFADEQETALKSAVQRHIRNFPTEGMGFPDVRSHMERFIREVEDADDISLLRNTFENSETEIILAHSYQEMGIEIHEMVDDSIQTPEQLRNQIRRNVNLHPNCEFEKHKNRYSRVKARNPLFPTTELFSKNTNIELGNIKFLKDTKGGIVRYFSAFTYYRDYVTASLPMRALISYLGHPLVLTCSPSAPHLGPKFVSFQIDERNRICSEIRRKNKNLSNAQRKCTKNKNSAEDCSLYQKQIDEQQALYTQSDCKGYPFIYKAPINADGRVWINHYGEPGQIETFEFVDVLKGRVPIEKLQNTMAFIGASADSLGDSVPSPFSPVLPGVEVHASVAANVMQERVIESSELYPYFAILIILFSSIVLPLLLSNKRIGLGFLAAILAIIGYIIYAYKIAFLNHHMLLPVAFPTLHFFSLSFMIVLYNFFIAESEKKFIRGAFSQFVSRSVVNEIVEQEKPLALGGERKWITVLFTDIRGFTTISESLDAQELTELLNQVLTEITNIVIENGGTLDKYVGDAMMCFWGAPIEDDEQTQKACISALQIQQVVQDRQAEWVAKFKKEIFIRVGINTGLVSVGNMGSTQVFDYTVIGDPVNVASRLESINRHYGTKILVGEETYQSAKAVLSFRRIDRVRVKGKAESINVYELLSDCLPDEMILGQIKDFEQALDLYIAGKFDSAVEKLSTYKEANPHDEVANMLLKRITEIQSNPSLLEAWDGAWQYD